MIKIKAKVIWALGGLATAFFLVAAVSFIIYLASKSPREQRQLISDQALHDQFNDGDTVVVGTVASSGGKAVENAAVILSLHNGDGQVIWRLSRPVEPDGSFRIRARDLPNIPNLYAGVIAAEAPNFLAEKSNISVDIVGASAAPAALPQPTTQPTSQPSVQPTSPPAGTPGAAPAAISISQTRRTSVSPSHVHLRLVPYSPWLTLVVLIPAIFGLTFAVLHLTQFARGAWVTYWYALGTAALWGLITAGLVLLYVWGNGLIPLFWPDLFVSSGVIVFAFVGNIIYVAYSLYEKRYGLLDSDDDARRRLMLTLGGRVLVAPYIALVAYGIFAATFPTLRTGPFAAFFGFFTGLWIKPVLEALNDIGLRLLSAEERQKVADNATRTANADAPRPHTSSAVALRPEQPFLDAVAAAREELLRKKGVIGVDAGFRVTSEAGRTGERAIVVYVYEKAEPANPRDRVPETFRGYRTDVVPLPPADPSVPCRQEVFNLSWEKLSEDNEASRGGAAAMPRDQTVRAFGQVLVLADPSVFFTINSRGQQELDVKRAFQAVKARAGDKFDFVAFIIDRDSGLPFIGNYNVSVHNSVRGIRHFKGDSYSVRSEWGTNKLLACQVLSQRSPEFRTYLHELAHSWCAYATFSDQTSGASHSNDLLMVDDPEQGLYHWGEAFDDGRSCMDYDLIQWVANGNGTFTRREIADDSAFNYCPLDLYLMGLIPPAQVGPLRILQNRRLIDSVNNIYQASVKTITVENVIASCGARSPAASPTNYRQALVVVSNDPDAGLTFAETIENGFRRQYETQFARATGGRATLTTAI